MHSLGTINDHLILFILRNALPLDIVEARLPAQSFEELETMTISRVRHLLIFLITIGTAVAVEKECLGQDEPDGPKDPVEVRIRLHQQERDAEASSPGHPPMDMPRFPGRAFLAPAPMQSHRKDASGFQHTEPGGGQPPQIHRPEIHRPNIQQADGPFAEDRKRIAALTESADLIAREGLPDVAHGLRERAQHLQRELGEKQKRMEQEARQRAEAQIHERRERARTEEGLNHDQAERRAQVGCGEHHEPALKEIHEQLNKLGHEMRELNEKMERLTEMLEHHHEGSKHHAGDKHHGDRDDDREMEADE